MKRPHFKIIQFVKGSERYGASVSIRNLCAELDKRGHDVTLLVFEGRSVGESPASTVRTIEIEAHNKFDLRAIFRLRDLFKRENPDAVHTHLSDATLSGSIAARLAHIPVVSTVHGMNRRWTYSFADHLIAVSSAGKKNLVDQGIAESKVSVAYNGIPIPPREAMSQRDRVRRELGISTEAPVLCTVSRADYGKGIHDGISACAMLRRGFPGLRYLVAGDGDYLAALKAQAASLGLSETVQFLGFRENVLEVLAASDLFVFPSLKEAMGISIVEAMAMELPIVATKVGGIPEVVTDDTGILVSPDDPIAVAEACASLLSDQVRRRQMGKNARTRAENTFSLRASAESVEYVYEKLVAGHRPTVLSA